MKYKTLTSAIALTFLTTTAALAADEATETDATGAVGRTAPAPDAVEVEGGGDGDSTPTVAADPVAEPVTAAQGRAWYNPARLIWGSGLPTATEGEGGEEVTATTTATADGESASATESTAAVAAEEVEGGGDGDGTPTVAADPVAEPAAAPQGRSAWNPMYWVLGSGLPAATEGEGGEVASASTGVDATAATPETTVTEEGVVSGGGTNPAAASDGNGDIPT